MRHFTRRDVLILLLALSAAPMVILGRMWKANAERGGQQPAEPFRIAGNFYYVGANDVTSFLITGPASFDQRGLSSNAWPSVMGTHVPPEAGTT